MRRTTTRAAAAVAATTTTLGLLLVGGWNASETRAQTTVPAATAAAAAATAKTTPAVALTGTWAIDPAHTNVNFAVRHMGISTVRGRFDDVTGTIVANATSPEKSSVTVTIKTASIDTDIKMRDDHLRSPDFFDAAKYPEITFRSTRIQRGRNNDFVAHGDLTMHGVTRPVSLPFKVAGPIADPQAGARFGIETRLRLNRQDYGIKYGSVLGNGALAIANDVDVIIGLEAVPAKTITATAAVTAAK